MFHRTWIVSEFYYPDENATGYLMTNLAKGIHRTGTVGVVCRRSKGFKESNRGVRSSVEMPDVHRVWSTHFSKDLLGLRIINIFMLSASIFFSLIRNLRARDLVLVVTNPPTLPYVTKVAAFLRRCSCVVLVYDVYPEVLIATNLMSARNPIVLILHWMTSYLFRASSALIVLGRDMHDLIAEKYHGVTANLRIIPNWVDTEEIKPLTRSSNAILTEHGLHDKFVVGYVGNMGRTHDIETLAYAARMLAQNNEIHFLFVGGGAKKGWLEHFVSEHHLSNITVLPFQDRAKQSEVHNGCDLSVISFVSGMAGLSVPSRMYNMMAAGKPILAITDQKSELAMVVEEENIGWVVTSATPEKVIDYILVAKEKPEILAEMGGRARTAAVNKYSYEIALLRYEELIAGIQGGRT